MGKQKQILSWYSIFLFTKNMKYACDRKFIQPKIIEKQFGMTQLMQKQCHAIFCGETQ